MTMGTCDQTFCPLPWIHLDVKTSGDLRVCSPSAQGPTRGLLRGENGQVLNLARASIAESRNAPLLKEIRQAILKGEFHPECHRCQSEEKAGVASRRLVEEDIWKDRFGFQDALRFTTEDGAVQGVHPLHFGLRLGNHCNLRCRSCSPTDSDGWYDDYVALNGYAGFRDGDLRLVLEKGPGDRRVEPTGHYKWHESDSFWDEFFSQAASIRVINMTGGEPFLIRRHFEFLKRCVESGHAGHITLEYNTNTTSLPKELLALWPSFERVKIGCSIDAIGAVNDYIRHPSRFSNIEKNLLTIDGLGENVIAWIACTVSLLNVFYLDDLVKWKLRLGLRKVNSLDGPWPLVMAHPLHRPAYLSVHALPLSAKQRIIEKLSHLPDWIATFAEESRLSKPIRARLIESGRTLVNGYIEFMQAADHSHLLPEFWEKTKRLDELRGQSLKVSLPELYELIRSTEP